MDRNSGTDDRPTRPGAAFSKSDRFFRQEFKCGLGSAEVLEGLQVRSALIAEDENTGTCLDAAQMMTMVLDATEFLQQHNLSNPR